MHKAIHRKKRNTIPVWAVLKAVLLSAAAATGLMLLFALLIYLEWLPDSAIPVGNTVIKVLSALFAGWLIGRGVAVKTWLYGGIAGALLIVLTTPVFSLFLGRFQFTWTLVSDLCMSFAIGSAAAALTARLGAKKKE